MMIDWSKLESYGSSNYKSFEELCYQIAKGLYEQKGMFTSINDSGGGDGVEFYLTLPSGDQWGWQAKFYYPLTKLSISNRKASIEKSLEKACLIHPNLKKWFLCTPTNFTVDEKSWFDNTLGKKIPKKMSVELAHWGDSDFNTWLSEPRFSGKRNYFFGELELNIDWFKNQVEKQLALIKDKFNPILHVEKSVDLYIHMTLGDEEFSSYIMENIETLNGYYLEFSQYLNKFSNYASYKIESDSSPDQVIKAIKSFEKAFIEELGQLNDVYNSLIQKRFDIVKTFNWKDIINQVNSTSQYYWEISENFDSSMLMLEENSDDKKEINECIGKFGWFVDSVVFKLRRIPEELDLLNQSEIHIFGDAGLGKTHIASHISSMLIEKQLPALFALGIKFTTNRTLEEQLRSIFDIPPIYSWNDFLQALDTAGEAYKTRIPIIIDGLNEATYNGTFSSVWKLGLPGLIKEISSTKNIVLITTCRTTYKEEIWRNIAPRNVYYVKEFYDFELKPLIEKYFNWYKIKADINLCALRQHRNPLYLKIFCECKNQKRQEDIQVYIGEQTMFEIFDEYVERCNRTICERNGLYLRTQVIWPALERIAQYLWDNVRRSIPISKLIELVDGQSGINVRWHESKTRMILDEGLVINKDWGEGEEEVFFTYDLLGGYIIASYLVNKLSRDMKSLLKSNETEKRLFSKEHDNLHPLYGDIRRCLLVLSIVRAKVDIETVLENNIILNVLVRAIFEVAADSIDDKYIKFIDHLFSIQTNRNNLFELAENTIYQINHPLNIKYWSAKLKDLAMPERDISWTEYVRENDKRFEDYFKEIEYNCQKSEPISNTLESYLLTLAEYVMWVLTSNVRPLRDKATKALYLYGRRYPKHFFQLLKSSFEINDPYISERMLAAIYGVAMARQNDFVDQNFEKELLPLIGRGLYELMFAIDAPHYTTHILAREYAKSTIEIAILHHPNLLSEQEKLRINPPYLFDNMREWGEIKDRDKGKYRDGNAPIHMDFDNYTIGSLVRDRSNYDFKHNEYKKIRANIFWRIYDLGYSLDLFGEVDKEIARTNYRYGRSVDGGKTDRYGKKYSWIAFFELAGLRQNKGLLKELYEEGRISDADIDPSFPVEIEQLNLVKDDFLGDRNTPVDVWIQDGGCPDMSNYLVIDGLCGEPGLWVLLDGYINQEDSDFNRNRFIFPRGLIVNNDECSEIVRMLENQDLGGRWLPEIPSDYYLYSGEIPWSELYQENEPSQLVFETKSKEVTKIKKYAQLFKGDVPLSEQDERNFWQNISDEVFLGGDINSLGKEDAEESIKKALEKHALQVKNIEKKIKETVYIKKPFNVLIPIRENNWEGYHSVISPGRNVSIPCKQIAREFNLCGQPQTFDLFERNGKRASITIEYGEKWHSRQQLTYLRKDLLDKYLKKTNTKLIWAIWGEREFYSKENNEREEFAKKHEDRKVYQQIVVYKK